MEAGAQQRYSHAYIIAAQPTAGYAAALRLAQEMLCTGMGNRPCGICRNCQKVRKGLHPDLITVARMLDDKGKPKREIYVDQIRDLAASAAVLPNEAERKIYIVRDAGAMNAVAQNAFLKLLEEPPAFDVFLLVADNADQLLETVRSRCVTLQESGEVAPPPPEARELAERWLDLAASGAHISLISFANRNENLSNGEFLDFVRAAKLLLADMLCGRLPDKNLSRKALLRLSSLADRAEEYLRFNVSTKHVFGMLCVNTLPIPGALGTQSNES